MAATGAVACFAKATALFGSAAPALFGTGVKNKTFSSLQGFFALINKDSVKDRVILDARPPNQLEEDGGSIVRLDKNFRCSISFSSDRAETRFSPADVRN